MRVRNNKRGVLTAWATNSREALTHRSNNLSRSIMLLGARWEIRMTQNREAWVTIRELTIFSKDRESNKPILKREKLYRSERSNKISSKVWIITETSMEMSRYLLVARSNNPILTVVMRASITEILSWATSRGSANITSIKWDIRVLLEEA